MKIQIDFKKIGPLMIVASLALAVMYPFFQQQIIRFFEVNLSSNHNITPDGERQLTSIYYFGTALLFGLGSVLLKAQDLSWRARMKKVFLTEPLCRFTPIQPSPRFILVVPALVGLFLIVNMRLTYRFPTIHEFFYAKDHGLLDLFVPAAMVISAILMGTAVWKLWREPQIAKSPIFISVVYLGTIGIFVFYAGEETSWGQDFLGWQTQPIFSGNVEGQTNLHNYFNAYFDYGYVALSAILVIVLVSAWLEFNRRWLPFNQLFLPHPSLIGLTLLIALVAIVWFREEELLEELVAVFILFYSFRIFACFRSKNLSIEA